MSSIIVLSRPRAILAAFAVAAVLTYAGACRPADDEATEAAPAGGEAEAQPEGETEPIENGALGIAIAGVPAGFELETNEGEQLALGRTDEEDEAVLTFELTPVQAAGVNLVEKVWEEKARVESLPDGQYRGQNELGGVPLGTTYTSRGRFRNEEGEMVEEYRALLVHPNQNRVLILDYEYPVPPPDEAQGQNRLEQLMQVLERVEPVLTETAEPPAPEDAPMDPPPAQGAGTAPGT